MCVRLCVSYPHYTPAAAAPATAAAVAAAVDVRFGTGTHSLWPFWMTGRSAMASLTVTVLRGAPAGRLVSTAQ